MKIQGMPLDWPRHNQVSPLALLSAIFYVSLLHRPSSASLPPTLSLILLFCFCYFVTGLCATFWSSIDFSKAKWWCVVQRALQSHITQQHYCIVKTRMVLVECILLPRPWRIFSVRRAASGLLLKRVVLQLGETLALSRKAAIISSGGIVAVTRL